MLSEWNSVEKMSETIINSQAKWYSKVSYSTGNMQNMW